MTQSYSQDDVQQILHRALAKRRPEEEEFSEGQLQEIALELGISDQDLELARQEWLEIQQERQEQQEFQQYRRGKFHSHLVRYGIVNTFLLGLDWVITPGLTWSLYVVLGWGLGVSLDGWSTYQPESERYQKEFQKWRQGKQFKKFRKEVGQSVSSFLKRKINEL